METSRHAAVTDRLPVPDDTAERSEVTVRLALVTLSFLVCVAGAALAGLIGVGWLCAVLGVGAAVAMVDWGVIVMGKGAGEPS
jgi:uncharacterized membrane protein YczE